MATLTQFPNGASFDSSDAVKATSAGFVGPIAGAVTGNVTGNVTGGVQEPVVLISADGTVAAPTALSAIYMITKAGAAAIVLTAPTVTVDDGKRIVFKPTAAHAHTITQSGANGFNGGGTATDVATFAASLEAQFVVFAYNARWYVENSENVTLG